MHCEHWHSWSNLLHATGDSKTEYVVNYITYVVFGMVEWPRSSPRMVQTRVVVVVVGCLFATLCAVLVKTFAPYACGSGVPEVKTILSGFIIRGYLGVWTLLIKSTGMILGTSANLMLGKEVSIIWLILLTPLPSIRRVLRVLLFTAALAVAISLLVCFPSTVRTKRKNARFSRQRPPRVLL